MLKQGGYDVHGRGNFNHGTTDIEVEFSIWQCRRLVHSAQTGWLWRTWEMAFCPWHHWHRGRIQSLTVHAFCFQRSVHEHNLQDHPWECQRAHQRAAEEQVSLTRSLLESNLRVHSWRQHVAVCMADGHYFSWVCIVSCHIYIMYYFLERVTCNFVFVSQYRKGQWVCVHWKIVLYKSCLITVGN